MQAKLNELNSAFQPLMGTNTVRTILLDAPTIADFYNAVSKEMPQIIHIVAENGFDLESNNEVLRFPATGAGAISQTPLQDLGKSLREIGVRVFVLEVSNTRETAQALAKYVPAVVGIQGACGSLADATFAVTFYRALLRTGQADFAITEARRALHSAPPPPVSPLLGDPNRALAPVLYQATGSGLIFEPLGTKTQTRAA